jgi:hypothetical protein
MEYRRDDLSGSASRARDQEAMKVSKGNKIWYIKGLSS